MQQKLTQIEAALLRIDSATFQRLCDEYLFCRYGADFRHISRIGTQLGKMQTIKGTPDTYVVLPNSQYVLIEYTKQQTKLLKKLKEDVAKCLDTTKTGLEYDQIQRIIIIHASEKLNTKDDKILRACCPVNLEIISLGELALSIHNDFGHLARRYLDIPYGTLQLQTPEEFIAEHTRKAIGENNPLTNPLRHRKDELSVLLDKIGQHHITVLSGGQGVGKTRLALAALQEFKHKHPDFEPFCIANKYAPLLEDLNDLVRNNRKYIFLIDDANRQTPILLQALEYLYAKPDVEFRIILTVRDYAFDTISKHLQPYRWDSYTIAKFTDEQIDQLIADDPFKIRNHSFKQRIRSLANGNPRLAIMAVNLALRKQNLLALHDATDLYVSYYDNLTDSENKSLLVDPTRLKVLALLAVFRQIDLLDEPFVERLTAAFELSRDTLAAELASLEKDELADVYLTDQSFFRLSDQNLATYVVYQVFIEKKLLSVEKLLNKFFEDYPHRIRDAFFGVINAFDQERIVNDVKLVTNLYYESIRDDDARAFKFLDVFFVALPVETLDYLLTLNNNLPSLVELWRESNPFWRLTNDEGPLRDRLRLLFNFLSGFNEYYDTALELLGKFAENSFSTIPLLTNLIKERLAFRPEDAEYIELRQAYLLKYLIAETESGNEATRCLLFEVLPFFLQSEFRSSSWRGRAVTFTTMTYPVYEPFNEFRQNIWEFISNQFTKFPDECRSVLFSYSSRSNEKLEKFDKGFIVPLIKEHLTPDSFDDCHFVNEYVRFLTQNDLQSAETDQLAIQFRSREYNLYLLLDWNRFRGRDAGDEMWDDPEQYKLQKKKELQSSLHLSSLHEIEQLLDDITKLASRPVIKFYMLENPLEAILSLIKEQSPQFFKQTIAEFAAREWSVSISRVIQSTFNQELVVPDDWFGVFSSARYRRVEWLLNFFSMIPASAITAYWSDKLISFFQNESVEGIYLTDLWWQNYLSIRPTVYQDILEILSDKYERTGMRYSLWEDFIEERSTLFGESDMPLLKKVYLQQFKMHHSTSAGYDYSRNNLKVILASEPSFLIDFIEAHYKESEDRFGHPNIQNLEFIWSLPEAVNWALEIVRIMKSKQRYTLNGSHYEPLFQNVLKEYKALIHNFLNEYVKTYAQDEHEIENMAQVLQHLGKDEEWLLCLQLFLTYNQSVEAFKKISWEPKSLSGSGKTNFDQIRADRLKQVLDQVRQMPKKLPYLEHIKYLEWDIAAHEKRAEAERRRQFGEDD